MAKPLTQKQLKAMLAKAEAAQKKVTTRLEELEKSKSYLFAQRISKILRLFEKK